MEARGKIKDFGIELVEKLDGMPKIVVNFELTEKPEEIKYQSMKWDGFFVKRDGDLNTKTMKALVEMGFQGDDPILLADGNGLDTEWEYFLQIEFDDKGYPRIEWINRKPGGGVKQINKAGQDELKKKMAQLKISGAVKKFMSENKKQDDIPNMFNENEGLLF